MDIDLVRTHDGATDADYSGVPFNVRFDPGVTSREFTVEALADDEDEDSETVEPELRGPSAAGHRRRRDDADHSRPGLTLG